MIYYFEPYYRKTNNLNLNKFLILTIEYIANISKGYEIEVESINKGYKGEKLKKGLFNDQDHIKEIQSLLNWKDSATPFPFAYKLLLFNEKSEKTNKLEYRYDLSDLFLNIKENEFSELINYLVLNGFPDDIIYMEGNGKYIPQKGILGYLGFKKCLSPKMYLECLKTQK